jgi:hypothetical protein
LTWFWPKLLLQKLWSFSPPPCARTEEKWLMGCYTLQQEVCKVFFGEREREREKIKKDSWWGRSS